jgi:hypothetical protein
MWRLRGQVKIAVLGTLSLTLPAPAQSGGSPAPAAHHFESSGVSFEYSDPLMLCKAGPPACPGCESPSTVIACVTYDK